MPEMSDAIDLIRSGLREIEIAYAKEVPFQDRIPNVSVSGVSLDIREGYNDGYVICSEERVYITQEGGTAVFEIVLLHNAIDAFEQVLLAFPERSELGIAIKAPLDTIIGDVDDEDIPVVVSTLEGIVERLKARIT